MAQLRIPIQDDQLPRVVAAFSELANRGRDGEPIVVDQTWIEQHLKRYVRDVVRGYEHAEAERQAREDAIANLPPDIT